MKKILVLFTLICGLMLTSCHNDEPVVPKTTFNIVISNITTETALVTVEPSDSTTWYYFDIIPVQYFNEYTDADDLAKDYIEWIEDEVAYCTEYGLDYVFEDWLTRGVDSNDFSDLTSETEYVAFAFAVDTSTHAKTGAFYQTHFTTLPVEEIELLFELAIDTAVWFLPNNEEITYFADYVSVDTLTAYGITAAEYFEVEYYGELIPYYTQKGAIYLPWSYLNPGETYVFLARSYDAGEWNSDLFTTEFTIPTFEVASKNVVQEKKYMPKFPSQSTKCIGKKRVIDKSNKNSLLLFL